MSLFPEKKYQKECADLCQEFDQTHKDKPDMSEEEKFQVLNEFTDRMTQLMLSYRYEKIQAERSRK
ncbi:hypothetical protein [Andreprevotia chitinilytica]|uniref:hypothetical protein n=1 Tax=Andreprevotia chitinilytica TaxID=396808 RepID=UPI000557EFB0|nr:hypothetical protein [Andreprevotia chitinilytica]